MFAECTNNSWLRKVFLTDLRIIVFLYLKTHIGSAKADFNRILDSMVLPGNTSDPSDYGKDFLCRTRNRPCP